jgi:uncharacterized membrane protein YraQ (UPF0718 family)
MSSVVSSQVLAPSAVSTKKSALLQATIAALLCVGIALYFWVDSRYPSLLKKLHSGKGIHISGALSFDALMPVNPDMPLATRIGHTTVNWMYTNRIGMTFGICFGAAVLTLLPLLPRRRFRNEFANTLAGAATGVPLGVCANCVAPVGQSLYQAGAAPGTVLATMISSPTLNVVVLAMLFALFPFPVALVRLAAPLVLIALVPWLTRRVQPIEVSCEVPPSTGWLRPTSSTFKQYLVNLGKLALTTVPLMALAGFLGAVFVELVPARDIPTSVSIVGILLIALVGAFLPVPIAFDVAASFLLLSRGVPLPYVVTLLCTLGAFSVYSVLILGRTISWKTGFRVYGAVALVGAAAGLGTAAVQAIR